MKITFFVDLSNFDAVLTCDCLFFLKITNSRIAIIKTTMIINAIKQIFKNDSEKMQIQYCTFQDEYYDAHKKNVEHRISPAS
uniref:Uncharacterized protein n=1 Tax=Romanomermis culicivorax TaxID=13658 RepID=A0A915IDS4_ROMCU